MRVVVDPYVGVPAYWQVAAAIRAEITAGRLRPGDRLQSAADLASRYDVGVDTVRDALAVLRGEGLLDSARGRRAVVRELAPLERLALPRGATVRSRMPTPDERRRHQIPEGVPVLVVTGREGQVVYAGDRYELAVP